NAAEQKDLINSGKGSVHGTAEWVWAYDPVSAWDKTPVVPSIYADSVAPSQARRGGCGSRAGLLGLESQRLYQLSPLRIVRFDDAAHLVRAVGGRLQPRG